MNEEDNKENNNNLNLNSSIFLDLDLIPMVDQLTEMGYDKISVKRLLAYYHPRTIDEALNYFLKEDGKIQHYFIEDQKGKDNKLCFICQEKKEIHLGYIPDNINNYDLVEDNNIYMNNILINEIINEDINNNINNNLIPQKKTEHSLVDSFSIKRENCAICSELFSPQEENTLKKCGHSFCNNCWYNFLSIKIKENKLTSIKCLDYECQEKLSDEFIINLVKSNKEIIEKYKKYKFELDIINNPNKKFCPYPNCDSYAELLNIKNKNVRCLNNHKFCFLCLEKPHEGKPCKDKIDKSMENFAKNHFIKKCPHCGIITEKIEGCNHITCSKCSFQWCWLCNQKYDPEHFREGKCKGLQYFKPKNENDIKLAFEGKINLNQSQIQQDIEHNAPAFVIPFNRRFFHEELYDDFRFPRRVRPIMNIRIVIYYHRISKLFPLDIIIYLLFGHVIIINGIITRNILRLLRHISYNKKYFIRLFSIFTYLFIFIPIFFIQFSLNIIMFIPFILHNKNFLVHKILLPGNDIRSYIYFKYVDNIVKIFNIIFNMIFISLSRNQYLHLWSYPYCSEKFIIFVYYFTGIFHIITYFHIFIVFGSLGIIIKVIRRKDLIKFFK